LLELPGCVPSDMQITRQYNKQFKD